MQFKQIVALSLIVSAFSSRTLQAQECVSVVEDSLFSPSVQTQMKFIAVLPKDYHRTQERYTTIYLLHPFGGNQNDYVRYSGLVKYLSQYEYIVICPDGKNSWYTNAFEKRGNFEDYLVYDLIPYVDRHYRTLSARHGRAIAGISMGGFGAMKLAVKRPSLFVFAGSFSGAMYAPVGSRLDNKDISESLKAAFGEKKSDHWIRNDPIALLDSVKNVSTLPYFYVSTGKDDHFTRIVENNRSFVEKLRQKGAAYEYHEASGAHSWVYWDRELRSFLRRFSAFDPLNP